MGKIKNIAVIYGGTSSEREISIRSGSGVHNALIDLGYQSKLIDFRDLEYINELKDYDFVFIALHGFEGEGGFLQKELDKLNILYSGSGPAACANTWDKGLTKKILDINNINTPNSIEIDQFTEEISEAGLHSSIFDPLRPFESIFLKPKEDGSSVDIFKIFDDNSLKQAYKKCLNPNRGFLFQEFIKGKELTVTVIDNECFPPIEIITNNEFYDYEAKYISNDTLHIEADLNEDEIKEIKEISLKAFKSLGCKGWARVDLFLDTDKKFSIIEINTVPGMTSHSNVPKSGSLINLSYSDVVQRIIYASL